MNVLPREPQYASCFQAAPVTLGPMLSQVWRDDPRRLGFVLARYKVAAKLFSGLANVAEIGCGDGFASRIVQQAVDTLTLYDFDPLFVKAAQAQGMAARRWDITLSALPHKYDGVYALDVFEHISPSCEEKTLDNLAKSLHATGALLIGSPSLESQRYASTQSKAGHVNCKSGEELRTLLKKHFTNVFMLGQNDETVHLGFLPMCHYLFALAVGPK